MSLAKSQPEILCVPEVPVLYLEFVASIDLDNRLNVVSPFVDGICNRYRRSRPARGFCRTSRRLAWLLILDQVVRSYPELLAVFGIRLKGFQYFCRRLALVVHGHGGASQLAVRTTCLLTLESLSRPHPPGSRRASDWVWSVTFPKHVFSTITYRASSRAQGIRLIQGPRECPLEPRLGRGVRAQTRDAH